MAIKMESSKEKLISLADYRPPGRRQVSQLYPSVEREIKSTGFDLFNYKKVFADEATRKLIREGRTIGCFYIESPGMRSLLKKTTCDTFEMLTAVSSIIRPGVAESGMMKEFIERHKNPQQRKYLIPKMKEILGETYGLMIYQEDVIKVAHHVVGLTLEEADLLRRAMSGKMRSHKAMQLIFDRFFDCCKEKGYPETVSRALWKQIESFAGYAFCKAHSASFALLSFQVAYLKAHHPAEFLAGVLNNGGGYYSTAVYITEAQRIGLTLLLPDVNESMYGYVGKKNHIRVGFIAIRNFEESSAEIIVRERNEKGMFVSLVDFLSRTHVGYERAESLIKCGATDCFGLTRPTLLRLLDLYFKNKNMLKTYSTDLFAHETGELEHEIITQNDFSPEEKSLCEYELFGYMISRHPLQLFDAAVSAKEIVKSGDMVNHRSRRIKMIGWYMASKRVKTRKGEIMKFLSLEDLSGTFEAVIFPEAYSRYAELTMSMGPYVIEGKVDAEGGNTIIVEMLSVLTAEKAKSITQKDRNETDFFGENEKPATDDEVLLVNTLGKEKLMTAYLA